MTIAQDLAKIKIHIPDEDMDAFDRIVDSVDDSEYTRTCVEQFCSDFDVTVHRIKQEKKRLHNIMLTVLIPLGVLFVSWFIYTIYSNYTG